MIPSRAKDAGVNGGETSAPEAEAKMAFTTSETATSSYCVSTALAGISSSTSFMRPAFAGVLIAVIPSATYCEAVSETLLLLLESAPKIAAVCVAVIVRAGALATLVFVAASV